MTKAIAQPFFTSFGMKAKKRAAKRAVIVQCDEVTALEYEARVLRPVGPPAIRTARIVFPPDNPVSPVDSPAVPVFPNRGMGAVVSATPNPGSASSSYEGDAVSVCDLSSLVENEVDWSPDDLFFLDF